MFLATHAVRQHLAVAHAAHAVLQHQAVAHAVALLKTAAALVAAAPAVAQRVAA